MQDFTNEIVYRTARSGGKGGQNVNKVETMVEACWQASASRYFSDEEKERIIEKLSNRISKDGLLIVKSSATRSQLENKQIATNKMLDLVEKSLHVAKKRKATKPNKAAKEKRLESKKKESQKKQLRIRNWKPGNGD